MLSRSIIALVTLSLALWFSFALPAQEAPPPKAVPATPKPTVGEDPAAEEIFKLFDAIPFDNLRGRRGKDLEKLHENVDKLLFDCEHYLGQHPASKARPRVIYIFAKMRSLNMQRALIAENNRIQKELKRTPTAEELNSFRTQYFQKVLDYVDEALGLDAEIGLDLRRDLLKVKGYCLHLDGRWDQAAKLYGQVMKEFPEDKDSDQSLCGVIQARIRAGSQDPLGKGQADYRVALAACDRFFATYPKSDLYPHVISFKGKALKELGDAKGGIVHWKKYRPIIEAEAVSTENSGEVRKDFNQILDQIDFHLGFLSYAAGDIQGALAYFDQGIELLSARERSGRLSQVGRVYKSRMERVANTLRTLQGKPTPALDIEYSWVEGDSFEVKQEQGNVVALFFSSYGNRRSVPFAQFLQRFNKEHWHEGFRAAVVGYLKGNRNLEGQILAAGQWRNQLGLTYPVGLDDTQGKQVYRRYNAMVGSGTIVLVDREGNVAWYKIDPTERDINLAREVLLRLLAGGK